MKKENDEKNKRKMKKANLKQKIARGIAAAGIGLASIVGGGCEETLSEGDLFNAAMQGYGMRSGTVEGMQSAAVLGSLGKTAADRQHELNVAREGRSEVNVYGNSENNVADLKNYFIITSINGESKIFTGLNFWSYMDEHKEEYGKGYIAKIYKNGKLQATVSK